MPSTTVTVTRAEAGQKLLQFLERRTNDVPRPGIMRWIRTGQVRVDGGRKKPFFRLREGMQVRIPPHTPGEKREQPVPRGLDVVYEDDDLLVLAKPAGLPVHGGSGHDDSVTARLNAVFGGAEFVPALVHRLDRDTSGLLLAGKTYAEVRRLGDLFAAKGASGGEQGTAVPDGVGEPAHTTGMVPEYPAEGAALREGGEVADGIGKIYLCWVLGRFPDEVVRLEDEMEKSADGLGVEKVRAGSGKVALAEAVRVDLHGAETAHCRSLVAVRLITGRTHQIRVQLAGRGYPLAGDRKYGPATPDAPTLMLHAFRLRLPERSFQLAPPWSGSWAVREEAVERAAQAFPE